MQEILDSFDGRNALEATAAAASRATELEHARMTEMLRRSAVESDPAVRTQIHKAFAPRSTRTGTTR